MLYPHMRARRWLWMLCMISWVLLVHGRARAHDLAIDQLVLWPDPESGILRGEITFDPELTRTKDVVPSERDTVRVRALLADQLRLEVDGDELSINFVIRELWVAGGATPGDIVVFTAMLPSGAEHLRAFIGASFKALVVSVQAPAPGGHSEAWSWLLRGGEWTPRYPVQHSAARAPEAPSSWQRGGPELFTTARRSNTADSSSDGVTPATNAKPEGASKASHASEPLEPGQPGLAPLVLRFVGLGYEHILPNGIDHLLFVAGLVLGAVRRTRHILISLTLFTLAHTLTLGLAQLRWFVAPSEVVEPLIALSICLVGFDNLRPATESTRQARFRHALVFGFGLVHGLGFANALAGMPLGRGELLASLLSFNVGVELGQLTFVLALLAALHWVRSPLTLRRYVVMPGSLAIAVSGFAFAVVRVLG